jgi:hypothetical protein
VVVLQQTAEPLTTRDALVAWRWSHNGDDQPVAQFLAVPLDVIMLDELTD